MPEVAKFDKSGHTAATIHRRKDSPLRSCARGRPLTSTTQIRRLGNEVNVISAVGSLAGLALSLSCFDDHHLSPIIIIYFALGLLGR